MMPVPNAMPTSALDEETARSELYGLLALLYYAPPATELIANLRVAATDAPAAGAFLEEPWRALVGVAREMTDAAIQSEYNTLFGGMSKPEVYLYGSHFLSGFLNEKPLARLRTELANLGLARDDSSPRPKTTWPTCARSCAI
jgi:TorA maturation chaperone TorD